MNNQTVNNFANLDYKNFSDLLLSLSPLELTALGCILGIYIAIPLNRNASNSLGNFFELIGQVMLTYSAQATNLAPNSTLIDLNNLREELFTFINNSSTRKQ